MRRPRRSGDLTNANAKRHRCTPGGSGRRPDPRFPTCHPPLALATNFLSMPRVVTFHYPLRDPSGRVLDTSAGAEPIVYLEGAGQIIEGLDEQLRLAQAGDKSRVTVPATKAYGLPDPAQVQRVKRGLLPIEGELKVGDQ